MNNRASFIWENITYQSRLSAFDQKRLDWTHNVGLSFWLQKKKDIYRLKRCLRDFRTNDHYYLFPNLFLVYRFMDLGIDLQNDPSCFLISSLGFFFLFSSFDFEHHHISYFYGMPKPSKPFEFFHVPGICLDIFNH